MFNPRITVLLCTVRPDRAYNEHPDWGVIDKVIADLAAQVGVPPFELIVVDGCFGYRTYGHLLGWHRREPFGRGHSLPSRGFELILVPPRPSLAVLQKKVAICAYRNTGLIHARGELVVNLDDCCELPPNYLSMIWRAWQAHQTCVSPVWPESGDTRPVGPVQDIFVDGEHRPHPMIYGFGSYPLKIALELNGYDEAFDLAQGLEDAAWSIRLHQAGVRQALIPIKGFRIHAQSGWSPTAVDTKEPLAGCCNRAWQWTRVRNHILVANRRETWTDEAIRFLQGPCLLLNEDGTCQHHRGELKCGYLDRAFATELVQAADALRDMPPVVDLEAERKLLHVYD